MSSTSVINSLKNYEQHILKRRSRLLAAFAMADNAAKKRVLDQMKAFSRKYPGLRINGQTLRRSMKARARYSHEQEHGLSLNKKLRFQLYDR